MKFAYDKVVQEGTYRYIVPVIMCINKKNQNNSLACINNVYNQIVFIFKYDTY